MTTFQQLGKTELNPFTVVRTSTDGFQASSGEFVITDQPNVELPPPSAKAFVAVRADSPSREVKITTPSGKMYRQDVDVFRSDDVPPIANSVGIAAGNGISVSAPAGSNLTELVAVASYSGAEPVIFVSDGVDWYSQQSRSVIRRAIPDSGLLHNYDPRRLSLSDGDTVSTRTDQEQSGDLSATNSPTYRTDRINNNDIVEYDGSSNYHQGTFASDISTPVEIFHVFQARSQSQSETHFAPASGVGDWLTDGKDNWFLFDGSNKAPDTAADTNAHIGIARFATDGELQLEDNAPTSSVDISNVTFGGITIAAEDGGDNPAPIDSGQFLIYDPTANGYDRSQVVSYLIDEWGPF